MTDISDILENLINSFSKITLESTHPIDSLESTHPIDKDKLEPSHPINSLESTHPIDKDKLEIIELFRINIKGKKIDIKSSNIKHDGKTGHWLEKQMGIKHNSKNEHY
jgi:hypothetical protein